MTKTARAFVVCAALACSACAAGGRSSVAALVAAGPMSAPIDVDRACLAARWGASASGETITVSVDNDCGRPLACDVHLGLATTAGPDLYLDCQDRRVPIGRTEALCGWAGQPVSPGGGGSMRCR